MRVRLVKPYGPYPAGRVVLLPRSEAKLLIKSGVAVISKDITAIDLKAK